MFIIISSEKSISGEVDVFAEQFDNIYLLQSVINNDGETKYKLEISEILKNNAKYSEVTKEKIRRFDKHVVKENQKYIFGYHTKKSRIYFAELDANGNFSYKVRERDNNKEKTYKINVSRLPR